MLPEIKWCLTDVSCSYFCVEQKKQEALEAERILREKEEQEAREKVNVLRK